MPLYKLIYCIKFCGHRDDPSLGRASFADFWHAPCHKGAFNCQVIKRALKSVIISHLECSDALHSKLLLKNRDDSR
jgi:hypothetical protein